MIVLHVVPGERIFGIYLGDYWKLAYGKRRTMVPGLPENGRGEELNIDIFVLRHLLLYFLQQSRVT